MPSHRPTAVVFDLGGVLIDWNPRYLFRSLFEDEESMERFLAEVCTLEWNSRMDAGRPFAEAVEELAREHPDDAEMIRAYHGRWGEMLGGTFDETLATLRDLQSQGVRVYALSNWSAETFAATRRRFPFLDELDGIVISGEAGVIKPDERIYRLLLERFGLEPGSTVFIDDNQPNVDAASRIGIRAFLFRGPEALRQDLEGLGLLNG